MTGVFGGFWFACKGTSDSTGGRAQNPLPLSVDDRGSGKRTVLVYVDDEDDGDAHPHLTQPLLYQLSNRATVAESSV